jgi:hypothetical protein
VKHNWTNKDRSYLKKHYPNKPTKVVAEALGVSEKSAYTQANLLGISKSEKYMTEELQRQAERLRRVGVQSRYKKGQEPPNKGQKMSSELYKKCKPTMFKKGHLPANHQPIGSERVTKDGYREIKIKEPNKWEALHRVEWEKVNGKIPKGLILVFKGDKMNPSPDNCELITRAENMNRNTYHNYPKEIANLVQLRGALTRQINKAKRKYEK